MSRIIPKRFALTLGIVVGCAVLAGLVAGTTFALVRDLPQIRSLETYRPSAVTRIYASDRTLLAELFVEKRDPIPLEKVPSQLQKALLATEDRKFYQHSGVDLKGILRAALHNLRAGEFVEGASTLTQQLAKTLFLTPRKTLIRKAKEAILAFQLERRYTKDEILELYLNQVYFGSGAYGVEAAARKYFAKAVSELDLSECAQIAAMPRAPSRYSPLVNPELAVKRRNIVLRQMRSLEMIGPQQFAAASRKPYVRPPAARHEAKAPYFVSYVKNVLEAELGFDQLYRGGLTVFTTLSADLQQAAEAALEDGLQELSARMQKKHITPAAPQGAVVALDVLSGGILAMTGGRDFDRSPFNRAISARRQPGSAFKPIVYAFAIEHGFSQNDTLLDAPVVYSGGAGRRDWRPENFSRTYHGEMTLRRALAVSANIPAVRLLEKTGPDSVIRFARSLGIQSPLRADLSLALGSSEVTLIELTAAYAVFCNQGEKIRPFGVTEVLDADGRVVWRVKPEKQLVLSRSAAAIVSDMLQAVVTEGTARKVRSLPQPVGGKTGTTDGYRDAMFIGFSPSIAAGVWVGRDDFTTLGKGETGARAALPIWLGFMRQALEAPPRRAFDVPGDLVAVPIDPFTGKALPPADTKATIALLRSDQAPRRLP